MEAKFRDAEFDIRHAQRQSSGGKIAGRFGWIGRDLPLVEQDPITAVVNGKFGALPTSAQPVSAQPSKEQQLAGDTAGTSPRDHRGVVLLEKEEAAAGLRATAAHRLCVNVQTSKP